MYLLDELREEHQRIEGVLGALRGYVTHRIEGGVPGEAPLFMAFFRVYADGYHHAREEDVLFAALVEHAELPSTRGPIAALIADHEAMRAMLGELDPLLDAPLDDAAKARLRELSMAYSRALSHHIDAENSVLLPECRERLRRVGVYELPSRAPTSREAEACEDGDALIARWPAQPDDDIVRGDGCAMCPSFGVSCEGVEREWWSESEWEEFPDHVG